MRTHSDIYSSETVTQPTPVPSEEGIFQILGSFTDFPSWEGTGVGFFQDDFYPQKTLAHQCIFYLIYTNLLVS